jgi:hypothetical protein
MPFIGKMGAMSGWSPLPNREGMNPVVQPRGSRRPRLRPSLRLRRASAPEGGPLARREERGIISNGVKRKT